MGSTPTETSSVTAVMKESPAYPSAVPRGATIGRYVVLDEVGSGGMGRVLRAYDPKLQREVALKDAGARGLQTAASQRLVAEARAMAKLSHANVVTVYDVEEVDADDRSQWKLGPVVLVMEYVPGRTLRAWMTEKPRTWAEIVARFFEAGRGLAAAHMAGLLHRDFKPSNVLVGDDDVVKVTDFGIAKLDLPPSSAEGEHEAAGSMAEGLRDDPATPHTETGVVMGSPRYMAPEQHKGSQLTVAADQYSFCVALWEALVGEPPFVGSTLGVLGRAKRAGPPPFPKSSVPRRIADAVRRGLAPEPAQRWPSMHALLEALSDDPARRRRRWIVAAIAVAAVGVGAASWRAAAVANASVCTGAAEELVEVWDDAQRSAVQAAILGTQTAYAEHVWTWTSAALDGYAMQWQAAYTDTCEAASLRKEQSTEIMDLRMACLHRAKLELQAVTRTLTRADAKTVEQAHLAVGALPALSRCADVDALRAEVEPPLPEHVEAVEAGRARLAEARVALAAGQRAQAERAVEAADRAVEGVDYEPIRTEIAMVRGDVLEALGKLDDAEAAFREALESALAQRQWDAMFRATTMLMHVVGYRQKRPAEAMRYRELASALSRGDPLRQAVYHKNLGLVMMHGGDREGGEAETRKALALWEEALDPDDLQLAVVRNQLAGVLHEQGDDAAAEAEYRRVVEHRERILGPLHPIVAASRGNLAVVVNAQGRSAEAEAELRRVLEIEAQAFGPEHAEYGRTLHNLGLTLEGQGKHDDALEAYRRSAEILEHAHGRDHPVALNARQVVAVTYLERGEYEAAEAEFRALLPRMEEHTPDDPWVAKARTNFAVVLEELGRIDAAEVEYRRAVATLETTFGPEHPEVAIAHYNHASVLTELGRLSDAEASYRRAIAAWDRDAKGKREGGLARTRLAEILLEQDRVDEAQPLADAGLAAMSRSDPPKERGRAAFTAARTSWASGKRARARELAIAARDLYRSAGEESKRALAEVEQWLAARGVK